MLLDHPKVRTPGSSKSAKKKTKALKTMENILNKSVDEEEEKRPWNLPSPPKETRARYNFENIITPEMVSEEMTGSKLDHRLLKNAMELSRAELEANKEKEDALFKENAQREYSVINPTYLLKAKFKTQTTEKYKNFTSSTFGKSTLVDNTKGGFKNVNRLMRNNSDPSVS